MYVQTMVFLVFDVGQFFQKSEFFSFLTRVCNLSCRCRITDIHCAEKSVIVIFQCLIYPERIPSRMLSHWMTMLLSRSVRECSCQKPSACSSSCCTVPRRVRQFFPPRDTSMRPRFGFQPTGAAHLEKIHIN